MATTTFRTGSDRRLVPRWMLGRRAASQFAGIAFLALAALIVLGALAALLVEARQLLGALLS